MLTLHMASEIKANTRTLLPLKEYDAIIVSFSGGKDSMACGLHLMEEGVDPNKIEWWHQCVDGRGASVLMDWPVTSAYCKAVADFMGIKLRYQWKVGGFEGEMTRKDSLTQPTRFELRDGTIAQAGGTRGKMTTREVFPQVSADLKVRWCSPYVKIDPAAIALNNDPHFANKQVLYVTGERRQESSARAKYAQVEAHRCDSKTRRVDAWRPVIDWTEEQVWQIIERHKIVPHCAYFLGWSRVSCLNCIFGGPDQWASVRAIAPERFARIAEYEARWGKTIQRVRSVTQQADAGEAFLQTQNTELVSLAMGREWDRPVQVRDWTLPAGAYKQGGGPS